MGTVSSEKEKMLSGELYDASDPVLVEERARARGLTREYNQTGRSETEERRELLEELFGAVGEDVTIQPPFHCDYGFNVEIGDEFFANPDCVVIDACPVTIGDGVVLGPDVHLYAATHPIDPEQRAQSLRYGEPIDIGDDVWIAGRAIVNPGVTIGDRSVVASGAVVTEDVPDGTVVGGNPATVVDEVP